MRPTISLILAILVSACTQTSARPSTTYEVVNYSVSIPDDLGVEPPFPDPETFWLTGFNLPGFSPDGAALTIRVNHIETLGTDTETAKTLLERNALMSTIGEAGEVTTRAFPAGSGAQVHWVDVSSSSELALDIVYLAHDDQLVTFTATGMTAADLALIVESFRFRVPPGDPLRPPSQSPASG